MAKPAHDELTPFDEELDRLVRELREWGRDHPIPMLPEPPVLPRPRHRQLAVARCSPLRRA
jgi:hypothetical protein